MNDDAFAPIVIMRPFAMRLVGDTTKMFSNLRRRYRVQYERGVSLDSG